MNGQLMTPRTEDMTVDMSRYEWLWTLTARCTKWPVEVGMMVLRGCDKILLLLSKVGLLVCYLVVLYKMTRY